MNSRETILAAVLKNQPVFSPLPDISIFKVEEADVVRKYMEIFTMIGGKVFAVDNYDAVKKHISENFETSKRIITTLPELSGFIEMYTSTADPHSFDDVELAVIASPLAVAENGAVWLPEQAMGQRIIPYICQHLAVVVSAKNVVASMHDAYEKTSHTDYGFGGFIGGPSKTADIEQALVMGAHGPITMTVFVML